MHAMAYQLRILVAVEKVRIMERVRTVGKRYGLMPG
jgi:hypothetical protein